MYRREIARIATANQLKEAVGISWTAMASENGVGGRGTDMLLSEVGETALTQGDLGKEDRKEKGVDEEQVRDRHIERVMRVQSKITNVMQAKRGRNRFSKDPRINEDLTRHNSSSTTEESETWKL